MLNFHFSKTDVPYGLARRAHDATSFVPEKRAAQEQNSYHADMTAVKERFEQWVNEENCEEMSQDLIKYRAVYLSKLKAWLGARSRTMSPMITGPANFPTSRNRKRLDTANNRMNELIEYDKKALHKLETKYNPNIQRPILSHEVDAVQQLQEKVEKLVETQETMKACNRVARSKKFTDEVKTEKLIALGITPKNVPTLLEPDWKGRPSGFPSFSLTNNNAKIKSTKARLTQLERLAGQETTTEKRPSGIIVERNVEDYRIRLIFHGKPDLDTRKILKSHGFRWSPNAGAWQRHLNSNGEWAVKQALAKIEV